MIELPERTPSFDGGSADASLGEGNRRVLADLAGFQRLEGQIERHHLGQRGRVAQAVGIFAVEDLAGLRVDDDAGVLRLRQAAEMVVSEAASETNSTRQAFWKNGTMVR